MQRRNVSVRQRISAFQAEHFTLTEIQEDNVASFAGFADVVISNGVLNLTVNKVDTLREWARILKPGGRLYIGDIILSKALPEAALDDISLWTG